MVDSFDGVVAALDGLSAAEQSRVLHAVRIVLELDR
jgi:hypothetical protein